MLISNLRYLELISKVKSNKSRTQWNEINGIMKIRKEKPTYFKYFLISIIDGLSHPYRSRISS